MGGKLTPMVLNLISSKDEKYKNKFISQFNARSKSESTFTIMTAIGCFGIGGIQRFYVGQTGVGILYLLTGGLIGIGTLYDLVSGRNTVKGINFEIANEIIVELDMMQSSK